MKELDDANKNQNDSAVKSQKDSKKQEYGSIQDHILFSSIAIVFENNRRTSLSLPVENHVSGRDERNLNHLK